MLFGGVDNRSLQVSEELVVVIDQREVDLDALLHGRIGTALGHALPVGLVGEFFADLGEVAAPEQYRNLVRINAVVCGLATVNGFHVERVSQHEGKALLRTEVGQPVPGEDTFDGDDKLRTIGCHDLEQGVRAGFHVALYHDLAVLVQNADVHASGVEIDAAVELVLCGVESPAVSSSPVGFSQSQHTTVVGGGGGLNKYQCLAADCLQPPLCCGFRQRLKAGV